MFSEKAGYLVALLRRSATVLLTLVTLLYVPVVNGGKGGGGIEEVTGVVLAYDVVKPTFCVDLCKSSLIVRRDVANGAEPSLIQIDLTFRPDGFPIELIEGKRQWSFMLVRTPSLDKQIDEFLLLEDVFGKEIKRPIWERVPGSEDEKLSFGETLHSYSLVKNGFKPIPR